MARKKIFNLLKVLIIIYCLVGIILYYMQDRFLFHPQKISRGKYDLGMKHELLTIPVSESETVAVVKFPAATSPSKGLVIYFHGNKINVEHYAAFASIFNKAGYEVWMPDYPGFGLSTGEITEQGLYDLGFEVRKMADKKYRSDSIIIYGKSLGSAIASYVAANTKNKMLILESTYYDMPEVMFDFAPLYPTSRMSKYKFPVNSFLQEVKDPVVIFQGTDDWITRFSNAEMLMPALKPGDKFIAIENGSHNDLANFDLYKRSIDSLLNQSSVSDTLSSETLK